jgi:ribosomal protein L12E/L44/L45/RPP1/RPP2
MSEALWIEHVYKRRYAEWQSDLEAGSAKALAMMACLVWRRDGRNVDTMFGDILDGAVDFDLNEMLESMHDSVAAEAAAAAAAAAEGDAANPTPAGSDPAGTDGTGTATSEPSASTSGSGRGKSRSSASRTSKD